MHPVRELKRYLISSLILILFGYIFIRGVGRFCSFWVAECQRILYAYFDIFILGGGGGVNLKKLKSLKSQKTMLYLLGRGKGLSPPLPSSVYSTDYHTCELLSHYINVLSLQIVCKKVCCCINNNVILETQYSTCSCRIRHRPHSFTDARFSQGWYRNL